jgi:hypothetical protein
MIDQSESARDLAVLRRITRMTVDPEQVDRIFRQTDYYKSKDDAHVSKWEDRADYKERTIKMAITSELERRAVQDAREAAAADDYADRAEQIPSNEPRRLRWVALSSFIARPKVRKPPIISEGILPAEGKMILSAPSGTGKSLLSQEIALRLANALPVFGIAVSKAYRVGIVQWENSEVGQEDRFLKQCGGLQLAQNEQENIVLIDEFPTFRLLDGTQSQAEMEMLADFIKEAQLEVLILDPFGSFFGGKSENDNIETRKCLDCLTWVARATGCAMIVIDHWGKPNGQGQERDFDRTRGASAKKDWADSLLTLSDRPNGEHRDIKRLAFEKLRYGAKRRPMTYELNEAYLFVEVEEEMRITPGEIALLMDQAGGTVASKNALATLIFQAYPKEMGSVSTANRCVEHALTDGVVEQGAQKVGKAYPLKLTAYGERLVEEAESIGNAC